MAQALVKLDPLPQVVVSEEGLTIPSWPAWATSRADALVRTFTRDPRTGKLRVICRLPESMIPTESMRRQLERAAEQTRAMMKRTPKVDRDADAQALVIVSKMLKALSGQRLDESASEAAAEAYMAAIEDIPVWAIGEAMRRWYRGACGDAYNYRWRPQPAELHKIAEGIALDVGRRLMTLSGLLDAQPVKEFTPQHKGAMLRRLADTLKSIFSNPIDAVERVRIAHRESEKAKHAAAYKRTMAELDADRSA